MADEMTRRAALKTIAAGATAGAACANTEEPVTTVEQAEVIDTVKSVKELGFPWVTLDPFVFCVHHDDAYPRGNEQLGPEGTLDGRDIGQDFAGKDGWRMYHGETVPGFPRHPHRGFETVTVVRRGLIDHADSLGAAARYGHGDVQWLTAGKGINHAEMFPLLSRDQDNPLELFQIWLNLPRKDKFADPYFTMLWSDSIPRVEHRDGAGKLTVVTMVAGALGDRKAPSPPPSSWASREESDLAIWTLSLEPGATFSIPAAKAGTNRALYVFRGAGMKIGGRGVPNARAVEVRPDAPTVLENGPEASELLMLQARPIGEPVVARGPFVMTTMDEVQQAYLDYRRTEFGGWPWESVDPVHGREGRFARHADGRVEKPA